MSDLHDIMYREAMRSDQASKYCAVICRRRRGSRKNCIVGIGHNRFVEHIDRSSENVCKQISENFELYSKHSIHAERSAIISLSKNIRNNLTKYVIMIGRIQSDEFGSDIKLVEPCRLCQRLLDKYGLTRVNTFDII